MFQTLRPWNVPSDGWHVDADYTGPLAPPKGVGSPSIAIRTCETSAPPARPLPASKRFHERVEEIDGIPLQVLENTATAGDVILTHPLLLHAPPTTHLGGAPRFLLNKDIYL